MADPTTYIEFSTPSSPHRSRVEAQYLRANERQDCTFPGCQLSLGHPPPHCVTTPADSNTGYWMVDDDGKVLRRL
jgi:hypothetical protein